MDSAKSAPRHQWFCQLTRDAGATAGIKNTAKNSVMVTADEPYQVF